jgi:hypothetical protein
MCPFAAPEARRFNAVIAGNAGNEQRSQRQLDCLEASQISGKDKLSAQAFNVVGVPGVT